MSIVRSYTEDHEIIREYKCDPKKIIEREGDSPLTEVDQCILDASYDTDGDFSRIDIEDDDGYVWYPV